MTGFWVYLNRSDLGSSWHNGTTIESGVVQIISRRWPRDDKCIHSGV